MLAGEHMPTSDRLHDSAFLPHPASVSAYRAVAIGGSAGGIPALLILLALLPPGFPLPILVVQHLPTALPSRLPAVLGRSTALSVKWAEHAERLRPHTVYIAPPDRHLLVGPDERVVLSSARRGSGLWRPGVDLLFESAAEVWGEALVAIVLSGMMWDGAKGIAVVARRGGITIVQDEASASHFEMPSAALDLGRADIVMSPRRIAEVLRVLTEAPF